MRQSFIKYLVLLALLPVSAMAANEAASTLSALNAMANEAPVPSAPPATQAIAPVAAAPQSDATQVAIAIPEKQSLFFTPNQIISIMRANQGFIAPREAFDEKNQGENPEDRGPRIIALTGIIYHGAKDWTIWLNGERVTPKNIPDRIMGLSVKSDRVHIRWMDIGNKRIVNITLRPNQQYLLDSDTIVPGT